VASHRPGWGKCNEPNTPLGVAFPSRRSLGWMMRNGASVAFCRSCISGGHAGLGWAGSNRSWVETAAFLAPSLREAKRTDPNGDAVGDPRSRPTRRLRPRRRGRRGGARSVLSTPRRGRRRAGGARRGRGCQGGRTGGARRGRGRLRPPGRAAAAGHRHGCGPQSAPRPREPGRVPLHLRRQRPLLT
jgi:hypothetical protein